MKIKEAWMIVLYIRMLQLICLLMLLLLNNSSSLIHMYRSYVQRAASRVLAHVQSAYSTISVPCRQAITYSRCFDSRLWSCGDDRTFLLLCVRSCSTWIFNKKYLPKQKGFAISVSFTHFSFRTNTYRRCRCGYHEGRKWLYDERRQPINSIHQ